MSTYQLGVKVSVDNSGVNEKLTSLQQGLAKTADEAAKTGDTLDKKLKLGANQAGTALTNLGRVAQDAPYGFIGISNNLSPLLESFQRLKVETGSTSGALKALGGSLIGGGGLGLALSVITSAISFASIGFSAWSRSAGEAKQKADEAKDAIKGIYGEVSKEAGNVGTLIAVLQNETETRQRKLAVLEQLKKIQPEIFGGLKLEQDKVIGLDSAYKNYILSLKDVLALKIKQQQLDVITEKLLKEQGVTLQGIAKMSGVDYQAESFRKMAIEAENAGNTVAAQSFRMQAKMLETNRTTKVGGLEQQAKDLIKEISDLSKNVKVDIAPEKVTVKPKKAEVQFPKGKIFEELFTIDSGNAMSQMAESIRNAAKEAKKIADDFFTVNPTALKVKPVMLPFKTNISLVDPQAQKDLEAYIKSVEGLYTDLLSGLGETIGNLFTKQGGGLREAMKGMLGLVGGFLIQLGKAAIMGSKLVLALKALTKNPITGLIAGIAAIAAGTLLKNIPGFAKGVNNFRGGMALVGERGPELVNLPTGSDVIPNDKIGGMMGGGMAIAVQDIVIDGNKLRIVLDRANQSFNRNF